MDKSDLLLAFHALSQETRLDVFTLLVRHGSEGLPAGEIARRLDVPPTTLSTHLGILARAALVAADRRGRSIVYRAEVAGIEDLVGFLSAGCRDGDLEGGSASPRFHRRNGMTGRIYSVLFLCTGNSARSILAESILARDGAGRFAAHSAGSRPKGEVDPLALTTLERAGYATGGLRSKSWEEFAAPDAPIMDFVFTVCDAAAGEVCPIWPGQPMTAHWGIEDPAAVEGPGLARETAFVSAFRHLRNRISAFTALPIAGIDRMALTNRLREIGRLDGATPLGGTP
jgi:arsenate reductase